MSFIFADDVRSAVSKEECEKLAQLATGKIVLEIGSYLGRSTIALASDARIVHAVDWHQGDTHTGSEDTLLEFLQNIWRYGVREKIVMHLGKNQDILPHFEPGSFQMVFIDSFHERTAVQRDLRDAYRILAGRGTIAFHDYGLHHSQDGVVFGVTGVVDEFVKARGLKLEVVNTLAVVELK